MSRLAVLPTLVVMSEQHDRRVADLGGFIKNQRELARLSLRRLSEIAGVSNPYLSQIERGLRRPSAEILQSIAKALKISAETLYVQAGILDHDDADLGVRDAIHRDPRLTDEQKRSLLTIYESFVSDHTRNARDDHEVG
jgi:transcriptional regulator with XRE-family HTH domain